MVKLKPAIDVEPNLLKILMHIRDMLKKIAFVAVACILLSSGSATVHVGVAHGLERIGIHEPVPHLKEITLYTARNEYEPFQIVVKSEQKMKDVTITVADLYTEDGVIFSRENFTFFNVHYVYVKTPSVRSKAEPGWYPDGLSPLDKIDISPEENTVIWVDVYTPQPQKPGAYTGFIHIEMDNPVALPLTVVVWNFTLPKRTSLKSSFGVFLHEVYRAHDLDWDSPELEHVFYNYYETLISHRVMPGELLFGMPDVHDDGSIDTEESHKHLKYFMDTLQVNSSAYVIYSDWPFEDPFSRDLEKTTRYLQNLYEYYAKYGWEDRFYCYVIDEPNDERAYETVRDIGEKLDTIHPGIRFLVTEQIVPDDPSWGTLYGYVDIWCPLFFHIEDEKELIRERQNLGEEVWTYTALCQGEKETPFWELDFPVLNYRVVEWMIWKSEISGLLYWGTNYWNAVDNPWEDPETWREGAAVFNGEGSLLYPADEGCLPSIRLKVLREGMEDYEYFVLLKSLGEESFVDRNVNKIVKSWYNWDDNPENLLGIRKVLGEKINTLASEDVLEKEEREKKNEKEEKASEEEREEKVEQEEQEEQEEQDSIGEKEDKEETGEPFTEEESTTESVSEPGKLHNNLIWVLVAGILGFSFGLLWKKTRSVQ